ncbi:M23 family metallopeptidase [Aestuariimicrobium sp. Y1814]|uniref:M23 family metallopeptidase n=1 Tax=Aestuariimicrobium sp. Y1814 TaxID=3418742 RepID=UPI003DA7457E
MNRDLPPADPSGPRNSFNRSNPFDVKRLGKLARTLVVGLTVLMLGLAQPLAHADELDDRKKEIEAQLAQSKQDLHDYNQVAARAAAALEASQNELAAAESALRTAEQAETDAAEKDKQAAAALVIAQRELAAAKAAAAKAKDEVDKWMKTVGATVIQTQQQRTDLLGLAVLTTDTNMGSLNQRVQWSKTLMDSTQAKLDRLRALQFAADAAEQKATDAEADVAAKRAAAQRAYTEAQQARTASQQARDARAAAVVTNEQARATADAAVEEEKQNQAQLEAEGKDVAERIADRIAAQKAAEAKAKAEAAAKTKAEADAAERRAAAARAEAAKATAAKKAAADAKAKKAEEEAAAAKKKVATTSASNSNSSSSKSSSSSSSSKGFIYPSGAVITSSYGQRFHPILRYWKLHDGTDFGASCGTPIKAAAAGVVEERYYNAGYGNRLIIDHGSVNGRYVTTSYNHATRYIVSVGQRVSQGQTIGYVGSTGYSTGCHLHFMAWVNGSLVNPMTLY